jgi:hypothetical protein
MNSNLKISVLALCFIGLSSCASPAVDPGSRAPDSSRNPTSLNCEAVCGPLFKSTPAERQELGGFLIKNGKSLYIESDRAPYFEMKYRELWAATLDALEIARKSKIASKVSKSAAFFVVKTCARYIEDGRTSDPTLAEVVRMILAARNVTATTSCSN